MEAEQVIASKLSLTLDLPPSCIQFCPAHSTYFVVGTYNLEKEPDQDTQGEDLSSEKRVQSRNGSLVVFRLDGDNLINVQKISHPSALLDLRFNDRMEGCQDILATVSSTGTLAIFRLNPEQSTTTPLQHISTSRCDDLSDDVLFLQCEWFPGQRAIGVTTSTGLSRLLVLDDQWKIEQHVDLKVDNSLEAWSIAFSPPSALDTQAEIVSTVYCGGDDAMMRYTTCMWKEGEQLPHTPFASVMVKNQHNAGVTSILPLPMQKSQEERLVLTGSYDDYIRLFLIKDLHESHGRRQVQEVFSLNLGGGVWRLNLIEGSDFGTSRKLLVMVSCMHAGCKVLELKTIDGSQWTGKVLVSFTEHQSMNYGSHFMRRSNGGLRCISTSFYDRLLCLWDYEFV